jgi:hypothetical protein
MSEGRKRASAVDTSGFAPRPETDPEPDVAALAKIAEGTPFKGQGMSGGSTPEPEPTRRGRPSRGKTEVVYARVSADSHARLQRIMEEKGWTLVTAVERAIVALSRQEGVD